MTPGLSQGWATFAKDAGQNSSIPKPPLAPVCFFQPRGSHSLIYSAPFFAYEWPKWSKDGLWANPDLGVHQCWTLAPLSQRYRKHVSQGHPEQTPPLWCKREESPVAARAENQGGNAKRSRELLLLHSSIWLESWFCLPFCKDAFIPLKGSEEI